MKAKKSRKSAITQNLLRLFCFMLLEGAFMLVIGLTQANAEILLNSTDGLKKQEPQENSFGVVNLKNGDIIVYGYDPDGSTFKKRFRYAEYDRYDSVFVLHKKRNSWYCFSLKTGAISKSYIAMGIPGSQAGERLIACVDGNRKMGFLDCHTGKETIPCRFYYDRGMYDEDVDFQYSAPRFEGNTCLLQMVSLDSDGFGDCIIDMTGKVLLDGFLHIEKTNYFDGYITTGEEWRESLYTKDLRCVLADKENISEYKVGIVYTDSIESNPMLVNFELTQTTPVYTLFDITECTSLNGNDSDYEKESSEVYYIFDIDYRLGAGVIDQNMNLVIDPRWMWDRVVPIGNGYFICYSEYTGFLMDKNGNFVVPKTVKSSPAKQ